MGQRTSSADRLVAWVNGRGTGWPTKVLGKPSPNPGRRQRWWHELLFGINKAFMDDDGDVHRIALDTYGIDFDEAAATAEYHSDVPIRRE